MNRTIEQWSGCQPEAMATEQSDVARTFAFADAKADILELHRENERLRETLQGIADADWRNWKELADPNEFVRWAQARARHALTPNAGIERLQSSPLE